MNKLQQIAAKAEIKIKGGASLEDRAHDRAVILSAIEKAHDIGYREGQQFGWSEGREHERKSRAAHASEQDATEDTKLVNWLSGDPQRLQRIYDAGVDFKFTLREAIHAEMKSEPSATRASERECITCGKEKSPNWTGECPECEQKALKAFVSRAARAGETDLLELAWGIIANAGGGDWERESRDWQDAAIRWRDSYFGSLPQVSQASSEMPNVNEPPRAARASEEETT